MKKLLVVQNITREGPGRLADIMKSNGNEFDVVDLDKKEKLPSIEPYGGLVVLGGPDSANDQTPKILSELAYVRDALDRRLPYWGVCLGLQVLVKAAGGIVVRNAVKEIGFRDQDDERFTVELTEEGKADPVFAGQGNSFAVFHLHGETVQLADNMALLGRGKWCENQVVRVGSNAYGIQSHFEVTEQMLSVWADEDPDLQPLNKQALLQDLAASQPGYDQTVSALFGNFLKMIKAG